MQSLVTLRIKSMQLYFKYKDGSLTLEDYLEKIKLLDGKIDDLELKVLSCYLQDNLVFEKSSLKQMDL